MNLIVKISIRNIFRQKRRNFLLGSGIAFGMCVLILANAFSHGISDILLNKIIVRIAGHITVNMSEKQTTERAIIRDVEALKQHIHENVEGVKGITENVITYGKGLGNGKVAFILLAGIQPESEFLDETAVVAGDLATLTGDSGLENPVAIYASMADDLNVGVNDVIRMRFETVYGRIQTARLTVAAILESGNPFMDMVAMTNISILKPLLEYKSHETGSLSITLQDLQDPANAKIQADRLHAALQPNVAGWNGVVNISGPAFDVSFLAIEGSDEARAVLGSGMQIVAGDLEQTLDDREAALISQERARLLNAKIGDTIVARYEPRFGDVWPQHSYRVGAIFQEDATFRKEMVFVHHDECYATYFSSPPLYPVELKQNSRLFPALVKEWTLLERSVDATALEEKYTALEATGWRGKLIDVQTMYENASDVLKIEHVLDTITMVAVVILFFIILVGVVNTLRMTIRERTREIGTIRAIGMQSRDVRWSFVTEVVLLTLFASVAGIGLALLAMKALSFMAFHSAESFFTVFLVKNHLHFVPTVADAVKNLGLISLIATITAYFPARKAAELSVVEALRHYE